MPLSAARREAEEQEAQAYARAIRTGSGAVGSTDWAAWNREIIARWSKTALLRVKTRAWQIVEQKEETGLQPPA